MKSKFYPAIYRLANVKGSSEDITEVQKERHSTPIPRDEEIIDDENCTHQCLNADDTFDPITTLEEEEHENVDMYVEKAYI